MIPFTLLYQRGGSPIRGKAKHPVVPRIGERVVVPGTDETAVVLTVQHDLLTNEITVVLT